MPISRKTTPSSRRASCLVKSLIARWCRAPVGLCNRLKTRRYEQSARRQESVSGAHDQCHSLAQSDRHSRVGVLIVALTALLIPLTSDAENVRVHGRTTLWAEISDDSETIVGWLADDLGNKLPNRRVTVRSGPVSRTASTNEDGEFFLPLPLGAQPQDLTLTHDDEGYLRGATFSLSVDPSRLPLRLQLVVPGVIEVSNSSVEAQIRALQAGRPTEVDVVLTQLGTQRELARGRTSASGWVHVTFDPRALAGSGRRTLVARFEGDSSHAPALARAETMLVDEADLTLSASSHRLLPDQRVTLSGALRGAFGPLAERQITIRSAGRAISKTTTDIRGAYRLILEGRDIAENRDVGVFAEFQPTSRTVNPARSDELTLSVHDPAPLPLHLLLIPAFATVVLVLVVLLVTRRRSHKGEAHGKAQRESPETGFRPSAIPSRSIRKQERYDFTGTIWDAVDDCPVRGARLKYEVTDESLYTSSDEAGRFHIDALPRGVTRFTVEASGYVPEEFELRFPHDGRFTDSRIRVLQIRHKALEVYRRVARPLIPRSTSLGHWTPREVAINAVQTHPWVSDEIAELTAFFEDVYYSPSQVSLGDLERVRCLARDLRTSHENGSERTISDS